MRTILRISLLGIFASSGIAIAIAVAHQLPASESKPVTAPVKEVVAQPAKSINIELPKAGPGPVVAPYPQPVANKVDHLEMQLKLLKESEQRERMLQLATKLDQFEAASRQHQRQLEDVKDEQRRQLEDASRRQEAMIRQLTQTIALRQPPAVNLQDPSQPAVQNTDGNQDEPADDHPIEIHRGEGDGEITLNLKDEKIRDLLEFLSDEGDLNILPLPSVTGNVTGKVSGVDVWTALVAILKTTGYIARRDGNFVFVGQREELNKMELLNEEINTRVYHTNYVSAAEIQKLITPMLSPTIGSTTVSTPSEVGISSDESNAGGDNFAGNEVVIVRDYEKVLIQVDDMVNHLDQRPRQVSIEAMLLSVTLDDSHKCGIDFEFLRTKNNIRVVGHSPLANLANIDTTEGGLNVGILDADMGAFINALNTIGDTDVIASPHLSCLNKQRAEILIGDQKGYLSTTQTETATTQTVDFLDVGTKLRIRPFISSDGMVRLEVHPELSTGDVKLVGDFALPEKSTTQVTTNIMIPDGCTVVIGGLIREDITETIQEVPFVGKIPVLGRVFRHTSQAVKRDEIIILLTPRIIEDPAYCEEGNECFADVTHRQATIQASKLTSIGRHQFSRRYYRLANSAWRAGNVDVAIDYLELAIFFHHNNRDALKLQGMILEDGPAPVEHLKHLPVPSDSPEPEEGLQLPPAKDDSPERELDQQFERGGLFDKQSRAESPVQNQRASGDVSQPAQNLASGDTSAQNQLIATPVTRPIQAKPDWRVNLSLEDHSGYEQPELKLEFPTGVHNVDPTQVDGEDPPMPASLNFLQTGD